MAGRKKASTARPMLAGMDEQSPHEKKLSEMHSALHVLGDKVRKPFPRDGEKLLPAALQAAEAPEVGAAKAHIDTLHAHFKAAQKGAGDVA